MRSDSPLLQSLRDARAALCSEEGQPWMRGLVRELDDAIGRLEGAPPARDLISIVCHDLKDPLASIVMGSGFLDQSMPKEDTPARRVVSAISRSAGRMNRLVGSLHTLANLEAGSLKIESHACDVVAILQGAGAGWTKAAADHKVDLRVVGGSTPVLARCDRTHLVRAIGELVDNAVRFTAPGGTVEILAAAAPGGGGSSTVRVTVKDTGRGIPVEMLPEIFDRAANARRSPRDGPGLGLAIVRGLVELQSGSVSAESVVGGGSTFSVVLPAAIP